jgi:purine-binding chemotaxis protein CheW
MVLRNETTSMLESTPTQKSTVLMVRVRAWISALPSKFVIEVMRRLPIQPVVGAPSFILGMSIVRGEVTPVISLGLLLGSTERTLPERFVLVQAGQRRAVIGVDEVMGVDVIDEKRLDDAPGLLSEVLPRDVTRIGVLDSTVLVMLEGGKLLSDDTWRALAALQAGES